MGIHALFSLAKPQNYDWVTMKEIKMLEDDQRGLDPADFSDEFLNEAAAWVKKWGWGFTITMVIIWPILTIPAGVFTKEYFSFWVFVSLMWGFTATFVIITMPSTSPLIQFSAYSMPWWARSTSLRLRLSRSRSEDIEMNGPRAKMMRSSEHDGPSLWICIFHLFST